MELLPRDQIAFQRMLDTIRHTFEQFGFLPVETPVMELSDVLLLLRCYHEKGHPLKVA